MQNSVLNSKIKLLKKSVGTQKCYAQQNTAGGMQYLKIALK